VSEQLWKPLKPFPFTLHTLSSYPGEMQTFEALWMEKSAVRTFSPFPFAAAAAVDEWKRSAPAQHVETHTAGAHLWKERESSFLNGLKLFSTTIRFQFKQSAARAKMLLLCNAVAFLCAPNTFYYALKREQE
jgi:hypothetical protein